MPGPTERSPLLGAAASPSYAKPAGLKVPDASAPTLPLWFSWAVGLSVAVSLTWLLLIVGARPSAHKPWKPSQPMTQPHDATGSFYLYAGVFNSLVGSFLSASGYCCQKVAHNRVQRYPELGAASQQRVFVAGLLVLAVGTISAVANLGILGQAVQAPFAALTLIYSALLGRFVLGEPLLSVDLLSSVLIVAGVAGDVIAAQLADLPPPRAYDLKSLGALIFRDSMMPTLYTITALAYITMILRRVHTHKLHRGAVGLLAFSSCAGVMAGFTSLATKSAVVVASSAFSKHVGDDSQQHRSFHHIVTTLLNPIYVLILLAIPAALVPQLYFLNKGLEHFGTLKFVPLYQAFIILGNMGCGMVFYNEMAGYGAVPLACFVAGIGVTLSGVCLLLAKVDRDVNNGLVLPLSAAATSEAMGALTPTFPTEFWFEDMEFATEDVTPVHDFEECKRAIVKLLRSAESSIYYSTFLCDFNQELEGDPKKPYQTDKEVATIASLLKAAIKRGVDVHVLYNPATDYGTTTTEEVRQLLLSSDASSGDGQIHLAYAESDLGPSWFTQWISNNSKYAFHHQKYLCVDGRTIMVTGCDVNSERAGWLHMNGIGYYWHELGVVAPCTPAMFDWIKRNHKPSNPDNRRGAPENDSRSPPFPLVAGGWREENVMVNLILHARESVQLENQILISGGGLQHNRICAALVARIARAHQNRESFHALVLTNAAQQDEPSVVTRLYCALSIQWSLEQLEACASSTYGISKRELDQYLFVGRLESKPQASDRGILIKVHSNILIVDGWHAVRTSSNLSDRSLSARPTDTELGLMFAGPSVIAFQQQLLNMYMGTTDKSYSVLSVIDHVRQSSHLRDECCIVELTKKTPWSSVLTWFLMNAFIYCSEGATGGRYDVSYTTTTVIAENATPTPKRIINTVSPTSAAASDENSVAIAC